MSRQVIISKFELKFLDLKTPIFLFKSISFRIAIHSLEQSTLGDHIYSYIANSNELIMSLSFSPSLEYLLVGTRSKDVSGYFLNIQNSRRGRNPLDDEQVVMLQGNPENSDGISYVKWSARPGDGIIIGYKTYQLRCLVRR